VSAKTVIVGTGAAGYAAAVRLAKLGYRDLVMVTDKRRAGTSRNAGSDKQTYYKLTLAGDGGDSVGELARTLFAGGAMDGDHALVEAAGSTKAFMQLVDLGVPFPENRYGEYVGYKTDHDPRQRATSAGPYTSRTMVEQLEARACDNGIEVFDGCQVVDIVTIGEGRERRVAGLLVLRDSAPGAGRPAWLLFRCAAIIYATGGPAGLYAASAYPHSQWGAAGAAFRAGARGKNLTEWQFGLASLRPRWNVSGTYMQALPRFVSTDIAGGDEREFLAEAIGDYPRLLSLTFLKGYQWPFDVQKARDGSSLIDLLVHQETVLRGRRVYLDYRRNPVHDDLRPEALDCEAYDYLARVGALSGSPVQRLRHLNEPAYQFYLGKGPSVDLEVDLLEVGICAQHNNGGLAVDSWWQSNLAGLFPVGEAAGTHGVYRPGGAALNSGQVGAARAAEYVAGHDIRLVEINEFATAAEPVVQAADDLAGSAARRSLAGMPDNGDTILRGVQKLMSLNVGLVRSVVSVRETLNQVRDELARFPDQVVANPASRQTVREVFRARDVLLTAFVYLAAIDDYLTHGGRSRGSALYSDPYGDLPRLHLGSDPSAETSLPDCFRFRLDGGALDSQVQEAWWTPGSQAGSTKLAWRERRPIPSADGLFEDVWRDFRDRRLSAQRRPSH
jgi:succinate dehydrogenase/fumarate reductase flavoprotein subunit